MVKRITRQFRKSIPLLPTCTHLCLTSNEGDSEEDIPPGDMLPGVISALAANSPDIGRTYNIAKRPVRPNIPIATIIVDH